jgi:hypothetical protein
MTQEARRVSANELLAHIFGNERGIVAGFSGRRGDGGNLDAPRSFFFRWPDEHPAVWGWLRDEDGRGREGYVCAHLLKKRRRVKANAAPLLALYVDGDGAKPGPETPSPTAVVESSPGKEQFWWRLTRPVASEIGESLNRRLALAMGGDKSGWDLTQLLRPPGTHNHKYPDAPLVVLREMTDEAHDPDVLDRTLPALPVEEPREPRRAPWPKTRAEDVSDAELVDRAVRAANGDKFARLWDGDASDYATAGNEGRSEADLALCSLLAFWCGPDESRIDSLFRQSGLMRPKWDERHYGDGRTYGQGTIGHAFAGRSEFWSEGASAMSAGKVYARRKGAVSVG